MGRQVIPGEESRDPLADDFEETTSKSGSSDFERMLQEQDGRKFTSLKPGDKVEGKVVSIGEGSVFIDVGQRSEGVVEKTQFTPEELQELKPGQVLTLFVLSRGSGGLELSKRLRMQDLDFDKLQDAASAGIPVEGKVSGENKGGFTVDLPGAKGFVPFSMMDFPPTKPAAEYIGKTFKFRVMRIERKEAVLSRVAILREEEQVEQAKLLGSLEPEMVMEATVVKIENFGAFVDLGHRLNALVPRSEVSWTRVADVGEAVSVGQKVTIRIMQIDRSGPKIRISASVKQAGRDPWETEVDRMEVGQAVRGRVTRLMAFGAFVELTPGVEGLIHISEMSGKRRVLQPGEVVKSGETVEVRIQSIDRGTRRIGLSLKALQGDVMDEETKAKYVKQQEKEQEGRGVELIQEGRGGSIFGDAFVQAQKSREDRKR